MNEADRLWDELGNIYSQWGIEKIPFSQNASYLEESRLREVFTGRREELKKVLHLFYGSERQRFLIYGWIGIGKTAFILEVLGVLQRKTKDTLTAYISLPPKTDLATASLIALAREMKDDEWAQEQLYQMGLLSTKALRKRKVKSKIGLPIAGAEFEEETLTINKLQFPSLSFEDLLKRALKKYKRVVIAIDDLDKQDPAIVRQLLLDDQGLLKSGAWFILTGHPFGLTRELLISERGLFDLNLKLEPLDQETMYEMLVNYLNSVRPKSSQSSKKEAQAVKPFTPKTARMLCERSGGVPRLLNRLGIYILLKAAELNAEVITPDILQQGFIYADQESRRNLTPEESMILDLILEKGTLSDASISLDDLQKVKAQAFSEILPILDKLVQKDLIQRLPNDQVAEFSPSVLLLPSQKGDT